VIIFLPAVEVVNDAPAISWRAIVYMYSKIMGYLIYAVEFTHWD